MALLSVKDLTVNFSVGSKIAIAVDGVSFSIDKNKTVALVGESGCGKTITALSILQLLSKRNLKTFSGSIKLQERELMGIPLSSLRKIRGREISMIFQEPMTSLNPVLTVGVQIGEVLKMAPERDKRAVMTDGIELLRKVGISGGEDIWKAYPGQLSGGMRQRVMIACAIAAKPKLLIADEPTTALDVTVQAQVLGLINKMKKEFSLGVLLVTHDLGVVAEVADYICVMYAGKIVEAATAKTLFGNPLHPYTQGLLKAALSLDSGKPGPGIKGQITAATDYPPGCRFHPRCPKAFKLCREEAPQYGTDGKTKVSCHLYSNSVSALKPIDPP